MREVFAAYLKAHPDWIGILLTAGIAGEAALFWVLIMWVRRDYWRVRMKFSKWKEERDGK